MNYACSSLLFSRVALFLVFTGLAQQAWSRAWIPSDLPSPQNDPLGICGRNPLESVVCDPDGYLSKEHADTIDGLANFIYEGKHGFSQVHCAGGTGGGAQLSLAVVERMGVPTTDRKNAAYSFARMLHDRWRVGDPSCENGVVLFFSIADRVMGVSAGRGVKSYFSDEHVQTLMFSIRDQMRQKEYGPALISVVNKVGETLSKDPPRESTGLTGLFIFFFITTLIIIISSICNRRDHRRSRDRYTRCRHVLERLDEDCDRVQRDSFVAKTCPICLEDFPGATSEEPRNSTTGADEEHSTMSTADDDEITVSAPRGVSSSVASSPDARRASNMNGTNLRFRSRNQHKPTTDATASEPGQSEMRALTLRCGHKFHSDCIKRWIAGPNRVNATCPVCRKKIDDDHHHPTPLADHGSSTREQGAGGWDVFDDEYRFRLQRARFYFPDFITTQMVNDWANNRVYRHGTRTRLATSPVFRASNPVIMARSAGRSGASFSFGGSGGHGGSSSGGGGGGASW